MTDKEWLSSKLFKIREKERIDKEIFSFEPFEVKQKWGK